MAGQNPNHKTGANHKAGADHKPKPHNPKAHNPKAGHRPSPPSGLLIHGRHAVIAALANPARHTIRLHATEAAHKALGAEIDIPQSLAVRLTDPRNLAAMVPAETPTQGLVLEAHPLPPRSLHDFPPQKDGRSLIIMLDQVEDPHNVGAILRSAAVFGAQCLITQDRHAPPESGVLAKAASGALDIVPWVRVTNISAALDQLAEMGYWRIGLAGEGDTDLAQVDLGPALVLVLGAEGRGLRPLTRSHCDILAKIALAPSRGLIDSLNVSNAAAVALYALSQDQP
ncbi:MULTISPECIES: RNA methyltransferase [unclassified Iodidimonas]|uniref:TrmH family RNA methyltransferase n=1 Tax=unclassified Iodidimonas TaxID=2626145 RepID=UPI002482A6EA|nr:MULTISPECIES: RNA methyltransferase [unclassified Iodidimonas]